MGYEKVKRSGLDRLKAFYTKVSQKGRLKQRCLFMVEETAKSWIGRTLFGWRVFLLKGLRHGATEARNHLSLHGFSKEVEGTHHGKHAEGEDHENRQAESHGEIANKNGDGSHGDGVDQLGSGVVDVITCGAHG